MLNVIEEKNIELYTAKAGVNITTSGIIKIDILAPAFYCSYSNLNNYSAVVKIKYGETAFLLMGDAEQMVESSLLNFDIDADVLKAGYHGSDTSSTERFIHKVTPSVVVISVGKGNSYGHPEDEALSVLRNDCYILNLSYVIRI
ncbi:MAG: hypothetical protein PUB42_07550 [Firmicutes bacterium]|nr:hypothetical protein [Bacillota bacterium]